MIETWSQAISYAEGALSGDPGARERLLSGIAPFVHRQDTMDDPEAGRHVAYLVALLETLDLPGPSRMVLMRAAQWVSYESIGSSERREVMRHQLVTLLAGLGDPDEAMRLLRAALSQLASASGLGRARTLANYAALTLSTGKVSAALPLTACELAAAAGAAAVPGGEGWDEGEALEIQLLALSVRLEAVRQDQAEGPSDSAVVERLAGELESLCRRLVTRLGSQHPQSLAGLVTLATAEFESARLAGARDRMERAIDVLAVAAQKAAATLGRGHPQAKAASAALACAEFDAARGSGDVARLRHAVELVEAAGQRTAVTAAPVSAYARPAADRPPREPTAPARPTAEPPARTSTGLRFTVLGPVRMWRGDTPLRPGSRRQRALLAALLLCRGGTATAPALVDALWGYEPPQKAKAALSAYVSRLRKALGEDAGALVSESGGYALRLSGTEPFDLDLNHAKWYADEAEKARASGDRARARDLLNAALDLWDGESLSGLPGPYAVAQRDRLEEWRCTLLEARLALDLELGRHAEAVSELTALTAAHPLRERLRELLMLALYRSGRQAESLAVYADCRRLLAHELGLDPGRALQDLQQRILAADVDLELSTGAAEDDDFAMPAVIRPSQLPATADVVGRAAVAAELSEQLAAPDGGVMPVVAVAGIGGVGKTTLAVHVAHAVREHFPDGQLYADLQGAGRGPAEPEAVLGYFLRALGAPDSTVPDGVEARSALYRSLLQGRRLLVLLDNARDAAQIRPLLPGTDGCATLITSRTRMVDLAGAYLVDLDVLSPEEARTLFTRIVGAERVNAEREASIDAVAACGFLPLAIRIAAARLASRRTWTVSVLARKLADERRRLDELQAGDAAVKATFELSYARLKPQQARAFCLLGLADGPDISLRAAAALLDRSAEDTEELLETLVDVSLLESAAPGRYRFHSLVRLYARACAERDECSLSLMCADALSRLLDFYLATALRMYEREQPGDRLAGEVEAVGDPVLGFADGESALDWLFGEASALLACAQQSTDQGSLRRAVDLLLLTRHLAESGADFRQYEQACLAALAAARAAEDPHARARGHTALAKVHILAGRFDEADEHAEAAIRFGSAARDPYSTYEALNDRGVIASAQGRHTDAEEYLNRALTASPADRRSPSAASALCNLSRVHLDTGRVEKAVRFAEKGLARYRRLGAPRQVANGMYALGMALTRAGRLDEAALQLTEAQAHFEDGRQRFWAGMTSFRLAELHLAAGRPAAGANCAEQALTALRGVGGEWWRAGVLTALGRALDQVGHRSRAQACWSEALSVYERLGTPEAVEAIGLLEPESTAAARHTAHRT